MAVKFSDFPAANPSLPLDLVGIQSGVNVRTTLVNPIFEDSEGLIETITVNCNEVVTVSLEAETINGAAPVTANNINDYIAAYMAANNI